MLAAPWRCEVLPLPIWNKVWACLATRFNIQKKVVQSTVKLDQPVTQYGRVRRLEGGDLMIGCHFVKETEDSHDASFVWVRSFRLSMDAISDHSLVQYTQYIDRHACNNRRTPDFKEKNFFGQLKCILLLELPLAPRLNLAEPTTLILALIHEVKATLRDGIYYYKDFGVEEVVDLNTVQCVVGRIKDRGEWGIIDRSDNVVIQVDWNYCEFFFVILSRQNNDFTHSLSRYCIEYPSSFVSLAFWTLLNIDNSAQTENTTVIVLPMNCTSFLTSQHVLCKVPVPWLLINPPLNLLPINLCQSPLIPALSSFKSSHNTQSGFSTSTHKIWTPLKFLSIGHNLLLGTSFAGSLTPSQHQLYQSQTWTSKSPPLNLLLSSSQYPLNVFSQAPQSYWSISLCLGAGLSSLSYTYLVSF